MAQVGAAVALAVQAGLQGPNIADWKQSSAPGCYFMIGFVAVCGRQFVLLYKQPQSAEVEHELARKRIRESTLRMTADSTLKMRNSCLQRVFGKSVSPTGLQEM